MPSLVVRPGPIGISISRWMHGTWRWQSRSWKAEAIPWRLTGGRSESSSLLRARAGWTFILSSSTPPDADFQADRDGGSFDYPADAFGDGVLGGVSVPCLSRKQQIRFHSGYEPRSIDLHDLQLLRQRAD
jgi:hypothetical protein